MTWRWATCTRGARWEGREGPSLPQAEYVDKLGPGLHSTKGVGKTEPDPAGCKELDGAKVEL